MTGASRCGVYLPHTADLLSSIQNANNQGYSFVVTPLVHPRSGKFTPHCDLVLSSTDWNSLVVGEIGCANLDSKGAETSRIEAEMTYAMHLGLPAIFFDCPSTPAGVVQLARVINSKICQSGGFQNLPQFWVQIPVHSRTELAKIWQNESGGESGIESGTANGVSGGSDDEVEDTWHRWNRICTLVAPEKRLGVVLELNGDLPDEHQQQRWAGEPVKAIVIPTSSFLTNKKGFPVLSRAYQMFIKLLFDRTARDIQFVIRGANRHTDVRHYPQYIEHLKSNQVPLDSVSHFAKGYEDYLQIPLQPLMDNLESCTYEVFEKDPVKYAEYQKAIQLALTDIDEKKETIIIMVVGAGRGPLVHASLAAAEKTRKKVHVYAVEKNPNAIVTLTVMREERWGGDQGVPQGKVEVVSCDMRDWEAPEKADIVVSELLGSFGDNELSPECLDGVWRYVHSKTVSIPISYTSYLVPIQSRRLHNEASMLREKDKSAVAPFETGYVVHMRNCHLIDKPQPLFTFEHSDLIKKPSERDHSRHGVLKFHTMVDVMCHGFAGYFETTLYGDVTLSTLPSTHTPGMFSWFPIYFPIFEPLLVKGGEDMIVHFWRLVNKRQVWYEWCISEPTATAIHNPCGRSYSIGLQ